MGFLFVDGQASASSECSSASGDGLALVETDTAGAQNPDLAGASVRPRLSLFADFLHLVRHVARRAGGNFLHRKGFAVLCLRGKLLKSSVAHPVTTARHDHGLRAPLDVLLAIPSGALQRHHCT